MNCICHATRAARNEDTVKEARGAGAAMSILKLSSPSTSSIIAAGRRVDGLAKKDQLRKKQRSNNTSTRRDPRITLDQVKKEGTPADQGSFVSGDVLKLSKTNSRAATPPAPTVDAPPDREEGPGETNVKLVAADRGAVLKACIGTAAVLSLAGFLLRQISHSGAEGGWLNVPDITTLMPYKTELWHIIPTVGVVVLVTSLRQILLQVWPDFAQSSEVANKQVLSSLEAVDFFGVSCLSGTSEEFLFRGAVLPFLGPDWKGVIGAGLVFGALHVTGGRNGAFAIWASFVGVIYGILGVYTCDLAAPMAAHSLANLFGAAIWKLSQNDEESKFV